MNKAKVTLVASIAILPVVMFSGSAGAASAHNEQTGAHNSDVWDSANSAWLKQQPGWEDMNTRVEQLGSTRSAAAQGLQQDASPPATEATPAAASSPGTDDVKFLLNRR